VGVNILVVYTNLPYHIIINISMFSYLFSKNPAKYWLQTLVLLAIIMFCVLLYKRQNLSPYYEGFVQDKRFVMKQGADIYDQFYVDIYDRLMTPQTQCAFETLKIVEMTEPSAKHSTFLDIGSGTGHLAHSLHMRGYSVFGIDNAQVMVDHSLQQFPELNIKCGNASEPTSYDQGSFTHILCTGMTLYHFQNKIQLLQNCFFWLMPGGYLVIHMVDPHKFDTIVPGGKPPLLSSPQTYSKTRITDTIIDFIDFEYKASYRFDQANRATFQETFTDEMSKNVRQNEITLYMEDIRTCLNMATQVGFTVKGMANMKECCGDEHQFLYILERTQ